MRQIIIFFKQHKNEISDFCGNLVFFRFYSVSDLKFQLASHKYAHYGSHHKPSRPTRRIAEAVKIGDVGVEIVVHFDFVGVKFKFGRIEKGFGACEPGNNHVELFDEVENVRQRAVRHRGGDIARNRVGEGWFYVGLRKLLFPRAFSF